MAVILDFEKARSRKQPELFSPKPSKPATVTEIKQYEDYKEEIYGSESREEILGLLRYLAYIQDIDCDATAHLFVLSNTNFEIRFEHEVDSEEDYVLQLEIVEDNSLLNEGVELATELVNMAAAEYKVHSSCNMHKDILDILKHVLQDRLIIVD